MVGFLPDSETRRAARRREEPPPAKPPKRQSVEKRRAALTRPPRRVRTTAMRPRMPDEDQTEDDQTEEDQTHDAQTDAAPELPPFLLRTQIGALVGILAFGVALFLGCAALSYVYEHVADGAKYRRPSAGERFIAALERGDAAAVNTLWRGGAMPFYDLTDCLDVNRQTKISSFGGKGDIMTIQTRVTYESVCAFGPHDEPLDRIYVRGSTGSVFYIGHTPRQPESPPRRYPISSSGQIGRANRE
jgi:hypothetical protein